MRFGLSSFTLLASLTLGYTIEANAIAAASRTPSLPSGETQTVTENFAALIDFNPSRTPVDTLSGYSSITSIRVDSTRSEIKGYAEYTLGLDRTYSTIDDVGGSAAFGALSLNSFLVAPSSAPDTINITAELSFNGQFIINSGHPTLALGGILTATTLPANPLNGTLYQSTLTFTSTAENSAINPVDTTFEGIQKPLLGGTNSIYSGASMDIISAQLDDLDAVVRLSFPVSTSGRFLLVGSMLGVATAEPDPLNNDADVVSGVGVLAASGAVDFSHTATLKLFLPQGYSLGGTDPLLSAAVFTSPVPTPAAPLQMMLGLLVLVGFQNLRRLRTK